jgi:hypothetical protein
MDGFYTEITKLRTTGGFGGQPEIIRNKAPNERICNTGRLRSGRTSSQIRKSKTAVGARKHWKESGMSNVSGYKKYLGVNCWPRR